MAKTQEYLVEETLKLELIEKFILELVLPEHKKFVHDIFNAMKTAPIHCVSSGFLQLIGILQQDKSQEGAAALHGLLLGIALCYGLQKNPGLEEILTGYLELQAKAKGENVINFFQKKAEQS